MRGVVNADVMHGGTYVLQTLLGIWQIPDGARQLSSLIGSTRLKIVTPVSIVNNSIHVDAEHICVTLF